MAESLRSDHKVLRACILYEVLKGTEIFDAYKTFSEIMGDDAMRYVEFEFWYWRFTKGNTDLNVGISALPAARCLLDLPVDIINRIADNLTWREQLYIRKVSHSIRFLIDERNQCYKKIGLTVEPNRCLMYIDDNLIQYNHLINYCRVKYREKEKTIMNANHLDTAIPDMGIAIKHPKLQLDQLIFSTQKDLGTEQIENIMKSLQHKIHVKKLQMTVAVQDDIMAVLPYLQPGILEEIVLEGRLEKVDYKRTNQILELEQWKQAKKLKIEGSLPIERISHFSHFEVRYPSINAKGVLYIRDKLLKSANFKSCHIKLSRKIYIEAINNKLGFTSMDPNCPTTSRLYKSPDSSDILEFEMDEKDIKIRRKH